MARKPIQLRALADQDLRQAARQYHDTSPALADRFLARIEQLVLHVQAHPAAGSLRYADALDMPGLRCWPCRQFPWLVFYVEREHAIEIIRVLHARQDIPDTLQPDPWGD